MVKTKDILIIGAVGIGALFLFREPIEEKVMGGGGGGFISIMPNLSGLFEGIGSMFENLSSSAGEVMERTTSYIMDIPEKIKETAQDFIPDIPTIPDLPEITKNWFEKIFPEKWFENLTGKIGTGLGRGIIAFPAGIIRGDIQISREIGNEITDKIVFPVIDTVQSVQTKIVQSVSGGGGGGFISPVSAKVTIPPISKVLIAGTPTAPIPKYSRTIFQRIKGGGLPFIPFI